MCTCLLCVCVCLLGMWFWERGRDLCRLLPSPDWSFPVSPLRVIVQSTTLECELAVLFFFLFFFLFVMFVFFILSLLRRRMEIVPYSNITWMKETTAYSGPSNWNSAVWILWVPSFCYLCYCYLLGNVYPRNVFSFSVYVIPLSCSRSKTCPYLFLRICCLFLRSDKLPLPNPLSFHFSGEDDSFCSRGAWRVLCKRLFAWRQRMFCLSDWWGWMRGKESKEGGESQNKSLNCLGFRLGQLLKDASNKGRFYCDRTRCFFCFEKLPTSND